MAEFLQARFDAPLELIRFEPRELSLESAAALKRKLERLLAEFNEMAEADSSLPSGRRVAIALLAACRPWEFSAVNALKRRRPPRASAAARNRSRGGPARERSVLRSRVPPAAPAAPRR